MAVDALVSNALLTELNIQHTNTMRGVAMAFLDNYRIVSVESAVFDLFIEGRIRLNNRQMWQRRWI